MWSLQVQHGPPHQMDSCRTCVRNPCTSLTTFVVASILASDLDAIGGGILRIDQCQAYMEKTRQPYAKRE